MLLLLRGDFRASQRALSELKKQQRTVAISLKETGLHQIAQQLTRPGEVAAIQINCCNGRRLSRHNAGSGGNFSFLSRRGRGEARDLYPDGVSGWRYAMGFFARA